MGLFNMHLWSHGNSSWTGQVIYSNTSWVDEGRMAGSQATSRLVSYLRRLTTLDLLNEELLPRALTATSSFIINEALRCLISEWWDSHVHINQPCSSTKAQLSPSQLFLKVKTATRSKTPFPFSSSDILRNSLFPFKCDSLFFIPCSPIIKMILLSQRQTKYSAVSSSCFLIFCVFVIRVKTRFGLFERWLGTHLSWLFYF